MTDYRGRLLLARGRTVPFRIVKHPRPKCQKKWTAWVEASPKSTAAKPIAYERGPVEVLEVLVRRFRPKKNGVEWREGRPDWLPKPKGKSGKSRARG